jgi:hypothetical protein
MPIKMTGGEREREQYPIIPFKATLAMSSMRLHLLKVPPPPKAPRAGDQFQIQTRTHPEATLRPDVNVLNQGSYLLPKCNSGQLQRNGKMFHFIPRETERCFLKQVQNHIRQFC